jgi:hypothetical protein
LNRARESIQSNLNEAEEAIVGFQGAARLTGW